MIQTLYRALRRRFRVGNAFWHDFFVAVTGRQWWGEVCHRRKASGFDPTHPLPRGARVRAFKVEASKVYAKLRRVNVTSRAYHG